MALVALSLASACSRGHHTTIINDTNGHYLKLEYSGDIYLTDDNNGVRALSPGGYFKYKTNDESITAERVSGNHIEYRVNDGERQSVLDDTGKRLLATAIKALLNQPHSGRK